MTTRKVRETIEGQSVLEGAGVRLRRFMGGRRLDRLDPFLLFDYFASDDPRDYLAGFPMHPHRGIETVTYMVDGLVHHKDVLGNEGDIAAGDVQWMTSGDGIFHEEMPRPVDGRMEGCQLWVNLPAKDKMSPPRYREVSAATIPEVALPDGGRLRVVAGEAFGVKGAVGEIAVDPLYLDVSLPPGGSITLPVGPESAAFAFVLRGSGRFESESGAGQAVEAPLMVVFDDGDEVRAAADRELRFLLIAGRPIREPVARYGPFVMNTPAEIQQALEDLNNGTFVKRR